jgi:hypothetical protein
MFSLVASIKAARPDLLSHLHVTAPPIPLQMPQNIPKGETHIEGIGEPINACFMLQSEMDPTGW